MIEFEAHAPGAAPVAPDLLPVEIAPPGPVCLAFSVTAEERPLEGEGQSDFAEVRWRTFISGDMTPSRELTLGLAEFPAGGRLPPHRHAPAEFYYGQSGSGVVTVDGRDFPIGPGVALYVPPGAEHGTVAGPEGLVFLYGFARDSFAEVEYAFSRP